MSNVQFLPKITAALISAAHFNKPLPHTAIVVGKVAKMVEKQGKTTFADGREAGPYFELLGAFVMKVQGPDGEIQWRASKAILPDVFVSQLALNFSEGASMVDFAIELSQIQHPTKPNLSMWTCKPFIEGAASDPLADMLALVEAKQRAALPAQASAPKGRKAS